MGHIRDDQRLVFSHQFDLSVLPIGRVSNGEDRLTEESLKTMSRYRNFTTICCAAVLALGLAACGGGDDGISVADRDAAVAAEQAKTEALQMEINALRTQLGLEDDGNVGDSVADLQAEVMRLKGLVDAAEKAENAEATKAMIATATALKMAIGSAGGTATHGDKGLTVDPDGGGEMADVTLKAGMGMSYSHMDAKAKVSYEAMVYSDRGMPTMKKFSEEYADAAGYSAGVLSGANNLDEEKIAGSMFPTAAKQTYEGTGGASEVSIPGTYDGAMGTYFCTGTCEAQRTANGIDLESGTWRFVHEKDAMVSRPDPDYLYYGWWVRKDDSKDGEPTNTNVFAEHIGLAGAIVSGMNDDAFGRGSATYMGSAAGKFAMTNTAAGTAEGGHFTADVTLTAKFGATTADKPTGLSGMIDNFMAGNESKPWSVTLNNQPWNGTGSTTPTEMMTTVWSIDGNKAAAGGTWEGRAFDTATDAADDGSSVPTDIIGTFNAKFETSGSMIGAFGTKKQ